MIFMRHKASSGMHHRSKFTANVRKWVIVNAVKSAINSQNVNMTENLVEVWNFKGTLMQI